MKKLLLLMLVSPSVLAAPFLITDPVDANADRCVYTVKGGTPQEFPVTVDPTLGRICKVDLASAPTGTNDITLAVKSSVWGTASANVPFAFTRPATVTAPANTRIVP
jgi:hypothetical protein